MAPGARREEPPALAPIEAAVADRDRPQDAGAGAMTHVVADARIAIVIDRADRVSAQEDDPVADLRVAPDDDPHRMDEDDSFAKPYVPRDLDAEERRLRAAHEAPQKRDAVSVPGLAEA